MLGFYPMTEEEHSKALKAAMEMNARMAKVLPRIVYDRKNDTVNVITEKHGLSWRTK